MDGEYMKAGAVVAAKVIATAVPSAVVTDVALSQAPALTEMEREGARVGLGAVLTLVMLAMDAPAEWAAGPVVGGVTVTAVNVGQSQGLAARLRDALKPSTPPATPPAAPQS